MPKTPDQLALPEHELEPEYELEVEEEIKENATGVNIVKLYLKDTDFYSANT